MGCCVFGLVAMFGPASHPTRPLATRFEVDFEPGEDGDCTLHAEFKLKAARLTWKPRFALPMSKIHTEASENERLRGSK